MGICVEIELLAKETCMLIDKTDDPDLLVRLISVIEADAGALEEPARAIAIELSVVGMGRFTAYGIDLTDGDSTVTTDGEIPYAAMKMAADITRSWATGDFILPFYDTAADIQ
jgi:hypothetical protein